MLTYEEAVSCITSAVSPLSVETIPLKQALGHVVADVLCSERDIPFTDNSAMDGYAFVSDGGEGPLTLKVMGDIAAGDQPVNQVLPENACWKIMTGATVPIGANTVVPRELVEGDGQAEIVIPKPPPKGANIRLVGEDIAMGDPVDMRGRPLAPADLGVCASLGHDKLRVYRAPRVGYFSTGEELVEPGERLLPGKVVNSNAWSLEAAIRLAGGMPVNLGKARDSLESTTQIYEKAKDCDMILSTGGVSMGDHDYVKKAMETLGMDVKFWKVAIKPGKPLVFAMWRGQAIFGLPGNPVSCLVNFELFVKPAIKKIRGVHQHKTPFFKVVLSEDLPLAKGRVHWVRVKVKQDSDGVLKAISAGRQGSGMMRSMSEANAMVKVEDHAGKHDVLDATWITGRELWS